MATFIILKSDRCAIYFIIDGDCLCMSFSVWEERLFCSYKSAPRDASIPVLVLSLDRDTVVLVTMNSFTTFLYIKKSCKYRSYFCKLFYNNLYIFINPHSGNFSVTIFLTWQGKVISLYFSFFNTENGCQHNTRPIVIAENKILRMSLSQV